MPTNLRKFSFPVPLVDVVREIDDLIHREKLYPEKFIPRKPKPTAAFWVIANCIIMAHRKHSGTTGLSLYQYRRAKNQKNLYERFADAEARDAWNQLGRFCTHNMHWVDGFPELKSGEKDRRREKLVEQTPDAAVDELLKLVPDSEPSANELGEVGLPAAREPKANEDIAPAAEQTLGCIPAADTRQIVRLWNEDLSAQEISEKLGKPFQTVNNTITNARKKYGEKIVPYHRKKSV